LRDELNYIISVISNVNKDDNMSVNGLLAPIIILFRLINITNDNKKDNIVDNSRYKTRDNIIA
jgi:flagellar assembly factor FliW